MPSVPNVVDMSSEYKPTSDTRYQAPSPCDTEDHLKPNGNRHVRYMNFCRSGLQILFTAVPENSGGFSLHYTAWVTDKAGANCFGTEEDHANFGSEFMEKPVRAQVDAIKDSWRSKVSSINKLCGDNLQLEALFDDDFYRAYIDYGDGWWIRDPQTITTK